MFNGAVWLVTDHRLGLVWLVTIHMVDIACNQTYSSYCYPNIANCLYCQCVFTVFFMLPLYVFKLCAKCQMVLTLGQIKFTFGN